MKAKAERRQKNLETQKKAHQEALAKKAARKNAQAKSEPKVEVKPVASVESKFRASSAKPQAQAEVSPELLDTDKQCAKKVEI